MQTMPRGLGPRVKHTPLAFAIAISTEHGLSILWQEAFEHSQRLAPAPSASYYRVLPDLCCAVRTDACSLSSAMYQRAPWQALPGAVHLCMERSGACKVA